MSDYSQISKKMALWYEQNARDLPWRKTRDPYKIWISEIMLQQTTVKAVVPYYLRWIQKYPTVINVARTPLKHILKSWQGLGYYQRARNIHNAAKIICRDFHARLPVNASELQKLPGFGPYTVGAVLSMAFDQPCFVIDANIRRVVMRLKALKGQAGPKKDSAIKEFLKKIAPRRGTGIFNQALMDLGSLVCRSKTPLCLNCPIRNDCLAYKKGIQEIIPAKKKRPLDDLNVVIAIIEKNGRFFIQKRPPTGLFAGLWEFPGGKMRAGEDMRHALFREIYEELGVRIKACGHFMNTRHFYTHYRVNLYVWKCRCKTDPLRDRTHLWVKLKDLPKYPMPSGSAKIVERLMRIANVTLFIAFAISWLGRAAA